MKNAILLTTVVMLAIGSFGPAMAKEDLEQPIQVTSRVYTYYRYDFTNYAADADKGANEFDLSRAYVRFKGKISDKVKAEVTVDAGREYKYTLIEEPIIDEGGNTDYIYTLTRTKTKLRVFVKYAYVDVAEVLPNHHIQGGIIATPWIGYEDKIWSWRVVRKNAVDENGYSYSADLGVGVKGSFGNGLIEHHFAFINGEGYSNIETMAGKDVEYRFSIFPLHNSAALSGLSANLFVHYGNLMGKENIDDDKELVFGGLAGLRHKMVNFGAGYFMKKAGPANAEVDGNIITAYGTGHLMNGSVNPFARFDMVEPDKDTANDKHNVLIAGCGIAFGGDWCSIIPNVQMMMPEASAAIDIREFFVHSEINF